MTSKSKCSIIKLNPNDNIPAASCGPQYLVSDYFPVVCRKIQDLILSWCQANRFPFRKRSFQFVRLNFEVAFKVLHEKQIKKKCVLQSSIVDFSPVLLLYSKATHSHQI